ncbi:hypothetical protein Nepgr_022565 [Nepenthes gracilis]|uniref:Uncharacterized protein n=1 Tax=Nepenthes gracilis TaxID=150966 RepID=A0AAD3T0J1_NEPGR|nr:hypothetical protein Nepgr_022565 [Nepenthes gracilis]
MMIATTYSKTAEATELPAVKTTELPCLAIQIYSPIELPPEVYEEVLVEDVVATSIAVEAKTGAADQFVAKLAKNFSQLIGGVAQTHSELESLKATREANKRLEAEPAKAKRKIASLDDTLKIQQVQYRLFRDKNFQLEEVFRTSVRAMDIAPMLDGKFGMASTYAAG